MVKLSVVIPFYGCKEGLKKCLAALTRQSMAANDFEIIVVENQPQLTITDVVENYPTVLFLNEPREGSYAARNKGITAASGDIIAFTDADCVPPPNWLQGIWAHFQEHPDCHYLTGPIVITADHDRSRSVFEVYDALNYFWNESCFYERHFGATANLAVRRAVFEKIGAFDCSLKSMGDFDFGNRVYRAGLGQAYSKRVQMEHPARNNWASLSNKTRRLAGGQWMTKIRKDGRGVAWLWLKAYSIRSLYRLYRSANSYRMETRIKLVILGFLLQSVKVIELLRLRLGAAPQR